MAAFDFSDLEKLNIVKVGDNAKYSSVQINGGTQYIPGDGYIYNVFTAPGTLAISGAGNIDIFIVAGGGGGGTADGSGGGGAGGVIEVTNYPATPGNFPVVVGGGGAGAPTAIPGSVTGSRGVDSSALNFTAAGGGGGKGSGGDAPGGSGGGGSSTDNPAGTATQPSTPQANPFPGITNYGNPGGGLSTIYQGGGGGGAGSPGYPGAVGSSHGGDGITWGDLPPAVGAPGPTPGRWFAGGGGGQGYPNVYYGRGGGPGGPYAGGGEGGRYTSISGVPGSTNTGGGGGGTQTTMPGTTGGNGGSGIVIVRRASI